MPKDTTETASIRDLMEHIQDMQDLAGRVHALVETALILDNEGANMPGHPEHKKLQAGFFINLTLAGELSDQLRDGLDSASLPKVAS